MEGIYKIKQTEIDGYFRRHVTKVIIVIGAINIGFIIASAFTDDLKTTIIIATVIFLASFVGVILGIILNNSYKEKYRNFRLVIENDKIIRKGEGLSSLEIEYGDISNVISRSNFIVILKKGIKSKLMYYGSKSVTIDDNYYIVIPNILEDFDKIKFHIKSKSYLNNGY